MSNIFWGVVAMILLVVVIPAQAKVLKVQHVVIVFQENRTPDNLFHGLKKVLPEADIADSGRDSKGEEIALTPIALANGYDLGHTHRAFVNMYDGGRADGADLVLCAPKSGKPPCPPFPQFKYVRPGDVMPYRRIAASYGFANRMFQSNQGSSFAAHQFILSGTSQLTALSQLFAAEGMQNQQESAGCTAPADQRVATIGPSGLELRFVYPCFEHQALTDLLNQHRPRISWRYYTPSPNSIWTAPNAIRHICRPSVGKCTGWNWRDGYIDPNPSDVLRDIAAHNLPAVSWVIPTGQESDHPGSNDGTGPSWVASIVNAIGNSSYWESTVILITWDDWGGWFDHVVPPLDTQYPYYENGFRVPLLVVSAYTGAGYVSNGTHDFGSILKFIEYVFGLPLIPPGNFADARADNLGDFFNFARVPRKFIPIPAPQDARFFLDDTRPATDPDDY